MDIGAGLVSFKVAMESLKLMKDMGDAASRNSAILELQEQILGMRESYQNMADQLAAASAKLKVLEDWSRVEDRYILKDYGGSTFAYELRPESASGEPIHRLCPNCYQQRRRSILQFVNRTGYGQDMYRCYPCKEQFFFGEYIDRESGTIQSDYF